MKSKKHNRNKYFLTQGSFLHHTYHLLKHCTVLTIGILNFNGMELEF